MNANYQSTEPRPDCGAVDVRVDAPKSEITGLPLPIRTAGKLIADKYRLLHICPRPGSEAAIFEAHAHDMNLNDIAYNGYRHFRNDTLAFSVYVDVDEHNAHREAELMEVGLRELAKRTPAISYTQSNPVNFDLAEQSPPRIRRRLLQQVFADRDRLLDTCWRDCEALEFNNLIGTYTHSDEKEDLGDYTYRRVIVCRRHTGSRKTAEKLEVRQDAVKNRRDEVRITDVVELSEQRLLFELHRHVYLGRDHRLPAHDVPQPPRVAEFISRIPWPWNSVARVAAGFLVLDHVKTHTQFVKQMEDPKVIKEVISSGRLYSPTVRIADKSFLGWSGDDLLNDRKPTFFQRLLSN